MIPAPFDYLNADGREALSALAEHGDEAKILAGGQRPAARPRMRLNAPEFVIDLGRIDSLRGIRDDGDAIVIGAMTPHSVVGSDPLVAEHAALIGKSQSSTSPTPRSGTAAPSAARSPTPTRRATSGRRRWRWGAVRDRRAGGTRTVRTASSSTSSRPRSARTRSSPRCADPQVHRLGRLLREVRPRRAPVADRRGRRGGQGGRQDDHRGAVGLTNMGSTPLQSGRGGGAGGPARRPRTPYAPPPRGRRRRQPAVGPERRLRLPAAPGDRPDEAACWPRRSMMS